METNEKIFGKINTQRCSVTLTRSKIGIIRGKILYNKDYIWEKRRTEGVEKPASRIIRATRFCSRRMRSKSVFEQFPKLKLQSSK
jgi:hypothetical protein